MAFNFGSIFKGAIFVAEEFLGAGGGNKKLHVAVQLVKALISVGVSSGIKGVTLGPADAHDELAITNKIQETVAKMNESGELPKPGQVPEVIIESKTGMRLLSGEEGAMLAKADKIESTGSSPLSSLDLKRLTQQ